MSGSQYHFPQKTDSQIFTSSGSFVVPRNVNFLHTVIAGGGAGGSGGHNSGDGSGAGGSGGQLASIMVPVTPGETISVSVGAGGAGGAVNSPGAPGSATTITGSFGTITAPGGFPGGQGSLAAFYRSTDDFIHGGGRGGTGRQPGGPIVATAGQSSIYSNGGSHTTYGGGGGGGLQPGGNGGGTSSSGADGGVGAGGGGGGPNRTGGAGGRGEVRFYWFSKF